MPSKFFLARPDVVSKKTVVFVTLFVLFTIVAGVIHVAELRRKPRMPPEFVPKMFEPRLLRITPVESLLVPEEAEFQWPMGTSKGAFVYDAQPFLTLNPGRGGRHTGADLNGIGGWHSDRGDKVCASGSGLTVFSADVGGGWGETILLAHRLPEAEGGRFILTMYSHLLRREVFVGQIVERGEVIGAVGDGGGKYWAHLHFEVRDLGVPHPSFGYSGGEGWDTLARLNPDRFLQEHAPKGDVRPVANVNWELTPFQFMNQKPAEPAP